jgi:hypothetical protein
MHVNFRLDTRLVFCFRLLPENKGRTAAAKEEDDCVVCKYEKPLPLPVSFLGVPYVDFQGASTAFETLLEDARGF